MLIFIGALEMKPEIPVLAYDLQSVAEEIANTLTHALGIILGVSALILLTLFTKENPDAALRIVAFSVYGFTLVFLYTVSTLYHMTTHIRIKRFLRRMDHAAIYILIAGTYTPVTLIAMRHSWLGWALLGIIWALAVIGVMFKFLCVKDRRKLSLFFYIFMGWLVLIAMETLLASTPFAFIVWLFIGGILYTFGVIFYSWHRLPFHHTIFHVFILMGSLAHFFGIFHYLT